MNNYMISSELLKSKGSVDFNALEDDPEFAAYLFEQNDPAILKLSVEGHSSLYGYLLNGADRRFQQHLEPATITLLNHGCIIEELSFEEQYDLDVFESFDLLGPLNIAQPSECVSSGCLRTIFVTYNFIDTLVSISKEMQVYEDVDDCLIELYSARLNDVLGYMDENIEAFVKALNNGPCLVAEYSKNPYQLNAFQGFIKTIDAIAVKSASSKILIDEQLKLSESEPLMVIY